ncbi:sensor histidine kinase [Aliikangiella coralliicola]|uniref:sensor histidine kinase n=1 Tax=Aliikangiella coralliicola TaxID=2592383 RepID=UPI00143DCB38|nr:ATP-binding protein [Aliikangiella coralliicola]
MSLSLLIAFQLDFDVSFLGAKNPELYYTSALFFSIIALVSFSLSLYLKRLYYLQLEVQIIVDIVLIILLMHASGGATSGLGVLIAVSTSAASILTGNPAALGFSVLASFAVLGEEIYASLTQSHDRSGMTQVGILSMTFMATSLLSFYLARRIIETEHVAEKSMRGLESMEKLNEKIIQFMSTGVLVVDNQNSVCLINRSAWIHLGMPESTKSRRLEQVSTPLARQLNLWRRKQSYRSKPFKNTATGPSLLPNFSPIGENKDNVIIFLEDTTVLNQQAQSLKLASLGRLTASIAHEIRNPLGALSHAAQLMKESDEIDPLNLGLVEIIDKNTKRVNDIIENIMKLSQRKAVQVKEINLSRYMPVMLQEYASGKDTPPEIDLQFQTDNLIIHFDLSQLSQILTNLIENAARYSEINTGKPIAQVMVGIEPHSRTAFLDVIDKGEGISPDLSEKIFEPFFTTSRTGTGLGLYLSKELCEANRARLDYIPIPTGGSCFRISFSAANLTQQ